MTFADPPDPSRAPERARPGLGHSHLPRPSPFRSRCDSFVAWVLRVSSADGPVGEDLQVVQDVLDDFLQLVPKRPGTTSKDIRGPS